MRVSLKVKMRQDEMFDFLMKHTYSSMVGYLGIIVSICGLLGFFGSIGSDNITVGYKILLLLTGLMFTVLQPFNLYYRSKRIVAAGINEEPISYDFREEMIYGSQDDVSVEYEWKQVIKIVSTKKSIMVYVEKNRALVLPRRTFEKGEVELLRKIAVNNAVNARMINFGRID